MLLLFLYIFGLHFPETIRDHVSRGHHLFSLQKKMFQLLVMLFILIFSLEIFFQLLVGCPTANFVPLSVDSLKSKFITVL